jgi:pimeloyl-ACP methyl ester carboxylesterase
MTMMSACWAWLAPELGNFARVLAYDRAGLGWSEYREGMRDAREIALELNGLLNALGITERLVLLGHSMGALFNRALLRERPGCATALIWLDPAHPDQMKRRSIRRRIRNLVFYIEAAQLLATKAVPAIEIPLSRRLDTLPPQDFKTLATFLRNPTHLRTAAREARAWEASAEFARGADLRELPLLLISARKNALPHWDELQADLACLSPKTRHLTFNEMSHISMLAQREHATKVASEIRGFLDGTSL